MLAVGKWSCLGGYMVLESVTIVRPFPSTLQFPGTTWRDRNNKTNGG